MTWEHFSLIQSGSCKLLDTQRNSTLDVNYELHTVSTGKQRVFWGRSITLDGQHFNIIEKVKGDSDSFRQVLARCNERLKTINLRLLVSGNSMNYSETPLSGGSGYGYVKGDEKPGGVGIMDFMFLP